MHETISTYQIEVEGRVDADVFNAASPLHVSVLRDDPRATLLAAQTDQSGLIGLLRHLHGQGFVLKSVCRKQGEM
jgi:hypothetical protein